MEKFSKLFKVAYIIIAVLTMLEYMMVSGMFTGLLVLIITFAAGIINIIISVKERKYNEAALYAISAIGLSMGYWKIMFF